MAFILEGIVEPYAEDGGQALIAEIEGSTDSEFFVRLQSWCGIDHLSGTREEKRTHIKHPIMDSLRGKKVRVTIEVLDEPGQ